MVRWSTSFIVFMYNLIDPCQYDSDLCYLIGSDGSERSIRVRGRYEYGDLVILQSSGSGSAELISHRLDGLDGWQGMVDDSIAILRSAVLIRNLGAKILGPIWQG